MKFKKKLGLGVMATLVAIVVPVMAIAGWYPNRPTRAWDGPNTPGFDYVTFNSFYNTPNYGQEMAFFDGKTWNTTPGGFQDNIPVKVGDEIKLRTYVHNNADGAYNNAAHNYSGIARNTKVKISLPQGVGTKMNAVSQISADNAQPGSIYDTVDFASSDGKPFKLSYVAGSAYANTHEPTELPLSDSIVSSGALLGEKTADGNVPGCFDHDMIVIVKVKVEAAPLEINKTVGIPSDKFVEQVDAKKGDRLYFKISYKNTGDSILNGVVLTDTLPSKLELIPGTVKLYNSNNQTGLALPDNALFTTGGQGVGDYNANANGYVLYQVKVKENDPNLLTNVACIRSTSIPYDTCDDAKVKTPPPPVIDICPNIPGDQASIPPGYIIDKDGNCVLPPPPVIDICPNIPGDQTKIPPGYIKDKDGNCVPPTPIIDVCPNIDGDQATFPPGYVLDDNGNCVVPTNPPVTPPGETPVTPETILPETGLESGLSAMLGMTAVSAGLHAYRKSKKATKDVVLSKNRK